MRFVLRRLGFFAVTLWAAISLNFLIPRLMPGNPAQVLVVQHPHLNPQALHALVALVTLAKRISQWGFSLMDAQVPNPHTLAMGAEEWPRSRFLRRLKDELTYPTRRGDWGKPEPDLEPPG